MRASRALAAVILCVGAAASGKPIPIDGLTPRTGAGVAAVGKLVCAAGGRVHGPDTALDVFECLDVATGRWERRAPLPAKRIVTLAELGGKFYAVGGADGQKADDPSTYGYDPRADRWTTLAGMPHPRKSLMLVAYKRKLYAIGGDIVTPQSPEHGKNTGFVEVYDPARDAWETRASMPTRRGGAVAGVVGGKIVVAGGWSDTAYLSDVEAYDPEQDRWSRLASLPLAREDRSGGAVGGRLIVTGGTAASRCWDRTFLYDPDSAAWEEGPKLPEPRCHGAATTVGRSLYILTGQTGYSGASMSSVVEIFDVDKGAWRNAPPAPRPAAAQPPPAAVADAGPRRQGKTRPEDFALIVGIDRYRSAPAAEFAERDAESFKAYAIRTLGVPEENVTFLTGDRATRTDFARYLEEWLPKNVEKNSRVYFYFSGHGAADPSKRTAYILPWDGEAAFLESSAYPLQRVYDKLGALKAREAIVFLDSCFSGGGRSVVAKSARPLVSVIDLESNRKAKVTVLTASAGDEIAGSLDRERHGLFTYYLLKGIDGEAGSAGKLTVEELHRYLKKFVPKAAHRENREQTPQLLSSDPGLRLF